MPFDTNPESLEDRIAAELDEELSNGSEHWRGVEVTWEPAGPPIENLLKKKAAAEQSVHEGLEFIDRINSIVAKMKDIDKDIDRENEWIRPTK